MKQTMANQIGKLDKKLNRESAKEQGFYDGRFCPRVVKDKKKEASKKAARNFKYQG